jgi:hypothetical protein
MNAVINAAEFERGLSTIGKGGNLPTVFAESFRYVAFQVLVHRNLDAATRMYSALHTATAMPKKCTIRHYTDGVTALTEGAVTWNGPKESKVASIAKGANLPTFDPDMTGRFWEVEKDEGSTKTPEQRLFSALEGYAKKQGLAKLDAVVELFKRQQGLLDALAGIAATPEAKAE